MLKFRKKKEGVGDFYGFDPVILGEELRPLNARCDTAEVEITVYPINLEGAWNVESITAAVIFHGSQAQCDARTKWKVNAPFAIREYKSMIRRRANKLEKSGDQVGSLLLLKTIGE